MMAPILISMVRQEVGASEKDQDHYPMPCEVTLSPVHLQSNFMQRIESIIPRSGGQGSLPSGGLAGWVLGLPDHLEPALGSLHVVKQSSQTQGEGRASFRETE